MEKNWEYETGIGLGEKTRSLDDLKTVLFSTKYTSDGEHNESHINNPT